MLTNRQIARALRLKVREHQQAIDFIVNDILPLFDPPPEPIDIRRQRVKNAAEGWKTVQQISRQTGEPPGATKALLRKMVEDGDLVANEIVGVPHYRRPRVRIRLGHERAIEMR